MIPSRAPVVFSPARYAHLGGVLYLLIILLGAFAEGFVRTRLVVPGDPTATAGRILADAPLWRLGVATDFVVVVLAVPLLWIEYLLLRPVSRPLATLFVMLNLVSLAVEAISKLFLVVVLPTFTAAGASGAFSPAQSEVLAGIALRSHDAAFNIALVFFGLTCLVSGYLIFRSGFLPRVIGVLMQVAGLSYLVACGAALFAPALSDRLTPAILVPPLIGEGSYALWLLVKGVHVERWRQRAMTCGDAE